MEVLAETETIHVKKSTYDCYEDNSMKMTHCINDFYATQLGCQLPWAATGQGWEECQTPETLVQFRNLSFYITTDEMKAKVEDLVSGLLVPKVAGEGAGGGRICFLHSSKIMHCLK